MNDLRKDAYRHLLYCCLLDLRAGMGTFCAWSPLHWWRAYKEVVRMKALADAMHNLSFFCSHDFVGFDEERFWVELKQCSAVNVEKYDRIVHAFLSGERLFC